MKKNEYEFKECHHAGGKSNTAHRQRTLKP